MAKIGGGAFFYSFSKKLNWCMLRWNGIRENEKRGEEEKIPQKVENRKKKLWRIENK